MCTPWASDWVVLAADWGGLVRCSGEWRFFRGRGWFESHLGHVLSLFRGFLASECGQFVLCRGPFGGLFHSLAVVWPAGSFVPWSAVLVLVTCSWA
jgi:hypothetical protein